MRAPSEGGPNCWAAATTLLRDFVRSVRKAPLSEDIGLEIFPADGDAACVTADRADVEVAASLYNADAFLRALDAREPAGARNAVSALRDAIARARHTDSSPFRVAVLVTGGLPDGCDGESVAELVALARDAARGEPPVRTAVVTVGAPVPELEAVARAGITGGVYAVPLTGDEQGGLGEFLDSLERWTGCTIPLPRPADPAQKLDANQAAIEFTPYTTGVTIDVPRLRNLSDCALNREEGWYFDDSSSPTNVVLCQGTCEETPSGSIRLKFCPPPEGELSR
jgi:hypothetical protein